MFRQAGRRSLNLLNPLRLCSKQSLDFHKWCDQDLAVWFRVLENPRRSVVFQQLRKNLQLRVRSFLLQRLARRFDLRFHNQPSWTS